MASRVGEKTQRKQNLEHVKTENMNLGKSDEAVEIVCPFSASTHHSNSLFILTNFIEAWMSMLDCIAQITPHNAFCFLAAH